MAEELKSEPVKKIPIEDLILEVCEEFKKYLDDPKWKTILRYMSCGHLAFIEGKKLEEFLEKKGWTTDDLESEGEKYIESLFPEFI